MLLFKVGIWRHVGVLLETLVRTWKVVASLHFSLLLQTGRAGTDNSISPLSWGVSLWFSASRCSIWAFFISYCLFTTLQNDCLRYLHFMCSFSFSSLNLKSQWQCPKLNNSWDMTYPLRKSVINLSIETGQAVTAQGMPFPWEFLVRWNLQSTRICSEFSLFLGMHS